MPWCSFHFRRSSMAVRTSRPLCSLIQSPKTTFWYSLTVHVLVSRNWFLDTSSSPNLICYGPQSSTARGLLLEEIHNSPKDYSVLVLTFLHTPTKSGPRHLGCRWLMGQLRGSHSTPPFSVPHLGHEVVRLGDIRIVVSMDQLVVRR